ncbi:MAG TPA: hypothetical protein VEA41_18875 [Salinarimonas sp.]|nr:hypothetical protein [Salinarimonas sp.]
MLLAGGAGAALGGGIGAGNALGAYANTKLSLDEMEERKRRERERVMAAQAAVVRQDKRLEQTKEVEERRSLGAAITDIEQRAASGATPEEIQQSAEARAEMLPQNVRAAYRRFAATLKPKVAKVEPVKPGVIVNKEGDLSADADPARTEKYGTGEYGFFGAKYFPHELRDVAQQESRQIKEAKAPPKPPADEFARYLELLEKGDEVGAKKLLGARSKWQAAGQQPARMVGDLTTGQVAAANTLSGRFERESRDFVTIRDNFDRVSLAAKDPSAVSDLTLIFAYMKTLDPNSVVRESEYATAENARGVPDTVRNLYNKVVEGQRLAPQQRAEFVRLSKEMYDRAAKRHAKLKETYLKRARDIGVPDYMVVYDVTAGGPDEEAPKTTGGPKTADEYLKKLKR